MHKATNLCLETNCRPVATEALLEYHTCYSKVCVSSKEGKHNVRCKKSCMNLVKLTFKNNLDSEVWPIERFNHLSIMRVKIQLWEYHVFWSCFHYILIGDIKRFRLFVILALIKSLCLSFLYGRILYICTFYFYFVFWEHFQFI